MRRLLGAALVAALTASGCGLIGGSEPRSFSAVFDRAIQLFPGGRVRVLGVTIGQITSVGLTEGGAEVEFSVDDPEIRLPADVQAAIVPASLLGERYVQLFPAYEGGPTLEEGATIPASRTAVPSEPDELLRSLQDYLGALDPQVVTRFVENAATALEGTGEELNALIGSGANVISTLADKRDDLATIIVEFERVASALRTRRGGIERVLHAYNDVVGTLTSNRAALEGTIDGLNEMSLELASLLLEHREPLHEDIRVLTRTSRTVARNVESLARTGHWAQRLFSAASRAVDYDRDWLRLNNQGQELEQLIIQRLEERLIELCADLGLPLCSSARYWERNAPSVFCRNCPEPKKAPDPAGELADAIAGVPELVESILEQTLEVRCAGTPDPQRCEERKRILLDCLDAADPESCLRRHRVPVRCLKANNVARCLAQRKDAELEDAVGGLLKMAMQAAQGGRR